MKWKLERRIYVKNKIAHGMLYDHEGKVVCHTLENIERDETTGFMRCLRKGEYDMKTTMLGIGTGAYNRKDCMILVGEAHPSAYVKDCLLHSATVHKAILKRIRQYEYRHKGEHIVLEVV